MSTLQSRTASRARRLGLTVKGNYSRQQARQIKSRLAKRRTLNSQASASNEERAYGRYEALQNKGQGVKGVDASDGFTQREARTVRVARRRQKAKRIGQRSYRAYLKSRGSGTISG